MPNLHPRVGKIRRSCQEGAEQDRTNRIHGPYYLASHDLKKVESHEFTLKRNKNSQDSVEITQPDSIRDNLRRFEAKVDGPLWLDVIGALPETLAEPLAASVKSNDASNSAIKQHIANGGVVEGASIKRGYHLRIE
jgi:hypothetical protein